MKISDLDKINKQKLIELDDKTYSLCPGDAGYNYKLDPRLTEGDKEAYEDWINGNISDWDPADPSTY